MTKQNAHTTLRVLLVEDSEDDALLILRELKRGDFAIVHDRVDTKTEFLKALTEKAWDLILCDYAMPHFRGTMALKIVQERGLDIPFIFVSGTIGEHVAVQAMKDGAHDYVMKGNLKRLLPAVVRELKDAEERRARKAAEEALRESETKFRTLAQTSPAAIFIYGQKFMYVNPAAQTLTGYSAEELLAMNFWDAVHPDHRDLIRQLGEARLCGENVPNRYEFKILRKGGESRWVDFCAGAFKPNGKTYAIGTAFDITERKLMEERLQKNQQLLQTLFETISAGIIIYQGENFRFVNNAALRLVAYSKDELLSKRFWEVLHPEEQAMVRERGLAQLRGESVPNHAEVRVVTRAGEIRWVDYTASIIEFEGQPAVLGTLFDITERKKAEAALVESEERYRSVVEEAAEIIFTADARGYFQYVNPAALKSSGYTEEELRTLRFSDLVPPEYRKRVSFTYYRQFLTRTANTYTEYPFQTKQGDTIWLAQNAKLMMENGEVKGLFVISRDITERRRMEEALAQERNLFRTLIDALPDCIYLKDTGNRFLLNNMSHIRSLGAHSQEEVLGKTDMDFRSKEIAAQYLADDRKVLATGVPFINWEEQAVENNKVVGWHLATKVPLRDRGGKIVGLVGISRDITERKRAEIALQESEERLSAFLEASRDAIIVEIDETIIFANKACAQLYGYDDVTEMIGKHVSLLQAEPYNAMMIEYGRRRLRGEPARSLYEFKGKKRDGATLDLEASVAVFSIMGKTHIISLVRDISDRKRLEEEKNKLQNQLVQTQKLESLGTLASGIAHDFNNILGIIMGHATMVHRFREEPEKLSSSVNAILKASHRGASLVRQLLTFARKSEMTLQPLNINEIIIELTKLINETFPKTVVLQTNLAEKLPLVNADPTQLQQVFLNLCVNARDAMPDGGNLSIMTTTISSATVRRKKPSLSARQYVMAEVRDTGSGMDEQTKARIFEPFFTTKGVGKGTGLGLSLVYGIVETHGGLIDFDSEVGKGTTFRVYIPVRDVVLDVLETPTVTSQDTPGGTETILVVEDEESLAELMKILLVGKGYTVYVAGDGVSAVELYQNRSKEIALVITDFGLPRLSGLDTFKKLKEINPLVKTILASGYIEPSQKKEILDAGIREVIQKPYNPLEILRKTREILDS